MENFSTHGKGLYKFDLPVGFRFHPTDEELISYYLSQKVLDNSFRAVAISEIDLNRCEPWDLPWRAKMGEAEWYFFCVRDRKYPTGLRTNRATDAGYWKATGKDKEIFKAKALIGMKKTLVFYKGRAPKGEKTNWVMHEYRLEGQLSKYNLPTPPKNEWVICRVFKKSKGGRKMQIRVDSSSELPPLMDASPYNNNSFGTPNQIEFGESSHVTCFSDPNQMEDQKTQDDIVDSLETPILASSSCSIQTGNSQYPENFPGQEQFMMRMLMENPGSTNSITKPNDKANFSGERDFDADISSLIYNNNNSSSNNNENMVQKSSENQAYYSSAPTEPVDIGSLWNF